MPVVGGTGRIGKDLRISRHTRKKALGEEKSASRPHWVWSSESEPGDEPMNDYIR